MYNNCYNYLQLSLKQLVGWHAVLGKKMWARELHVSFITFIRILFYFLYVNWKLEKTDSFLEGNCFLKRFLTSLKLQMYIIYSSGYHGIRCSGHGPYSSDTE